MKQLSPEYVRQSPKKKLVESETTQPHWGPCKSRSRASCPVYTKDSLGASGVWDDLLTTRSQMSPPTCASVMAGARSGWAQNRFRQGTPAIAEFKFVSYDSENLNGADLPHPPVTCGRR